MRSNAGREPATSQTRIDQLDSLRGLAALSVVFSHWISLNLPTYVPGRETAIFREAISRHDPTVLVKLGKTSLLYMSPLRIVFGGGEAVVLFFVLSGFVLSLPYWRGQQVPYRSFVVKRVFRIYVPYLAALMLAIAGNAWLSRGGITGMNEWFNATWTLPIQPATIIGNISLIGVFNDMQFNTAFWSLIHEMRISLIFPGVMMLVRNNERFGACIMVPLILAGCFLSTIWPVGRLFQSVEVLGFFLAGAYLARSRDRIAAAYDNWLPGKRYAFVLGSAALYSCGWSWVMPAHVLGLSEGYKDLFICGGAAGLVAASVASPAIRHFLMMGPLPALGRMSYSLYLTHATVLFGLVYLLYGHLGFGGIFALYVASSILAGATFRRFVEDPANRTGRKLARQMEGRLPQVS
jgi:peptidoglycan/LPS O-acetylase OafA/YrhL